MRFKTTSTVMICLSIFFFLGCNQSETVPAERNRVSRTAVKGTSLTSGQFQLLMNNIANGWSTQSTDLALSSFDEAAVYMEPPDIQFYTGHDQLRPYFDAVKPGTTMQWHQLWFDESTQNGCGEYTFHMGGSLRAVHGVVIVELRAGKIKFWREYQRPGPVKHSEFKNTVNKQWKWHIGNYPAPEEKQDK